MAAIGTKRKIHNVARVSPDAKKPRSLVCEDGNNADTHRGKRAEGRDKTPGSGTDSLPVERDSHDASSFGHDKEYSHDDESEEETAATENEDGDDKQAEDSDSDEEAYNSEDEDDEGDTIMGFGRHFDKTFRQVYQEYPGYYKWAKRIDSPSPRLQRFLDWVDGDIARPNENTILTIGKHSGRTFSYICRHDPGYVAWGLSLTITFEGAERAPRLAPETTSSITCRFVRERFCS